MSAIEIAVRLLTGQEYWLYVEENDSIGNVRHQIELKTGIPSDQMRLIFGSKQLGGGQHHFMASGETKPCLDKKLILLNLDTPLNKLFRSGGQGDVRIEQDGGWVAERPDFSVELREKSLVWPSGFSARFIRTRALPEDGKTYELPCGIETMPLTSVDNYSAATEEMKKKGGVVLQMKSDDAFYIEFSVAPQHHWTGGYDHAIQVGVGKINAITGEKWKESLSESPQNYLVFPKQPWLDGINNGAGTIRQFRITEMGKGATVEEQLKPTEEEHRGIQLIAYPCAESHAARHFVHFDRLYYCDKKDGDQEKHLSLDVDTTLRQHGFKEGDLFYSKDSSESNLSHGYTLADYNIPNKGRLNLILRLRGGGGSEYTSLKATLETASNGLKQRNKENKLGVAVGGTMKQKIYPDEHGTFYWKSLGQRCFVHIVEDESGRKQDSDPGSFKLSDDVESSVKGSALLAMVKSLGAVKNQTSKKIQDGVW